MTTDRKRRANQRNAQRSTGPRTQAGKARSKQNAWKHGLAVPISVQPHLADLIDFVANCLARETPSAHPRDQEVRALAVAILEVLRVRSICSHILDEWARQYCAPVVAGSSASQVDRTELLQHLLRADRYERRAVSRRKSALRAYLEAYARPGQDNACRTSRR
jgi:hypothetical protein